jgi:hypothetical protein
LPAETVKEIVDRTDGVPLFVEELTKTVLEGHGDSGRAEGASISALALPATLHASLMARLDRLGPGAKQVAQTGVAIGREFSYELLGAVAGRTGRELRDELARLVTSELVFQRGTPPESVYTFKHALVQDAAYSTLLRSDRQQLHARIAEAVEQLLPERSTAPIPSPAPEAIVVEHLPAPKEVTQTIFVLRSFKYKSGMRHRFAPQYEDHELPVELAQKALRVGVATVLTDDRRKQLRGTRSGAINVNAVDVTDLDAVEMPAAGEKYIGPDPVLRAADFRTLPTRPDRILKVAGPSI